MNPEHQISSAVALTLILARENLPMCQWLVFSEMGLEGWLLDTAGNNAVSQLEQWARYLRGNVQIDRNSHIGFVRGRYEGVQIMITGKVRDHA